MGIESGRIRYSRLLQYSVKAGHAKVIFYVRSLSRMMQQGDAPAFCGSHCDAICPEYWLAVA